MTPAVVLDALDDDLAYTTVMTILTRLWRKGLASRSQQGRAYAYEAAVTEADLVASKMRETLETSSNRNAALNRFVGGLTKREASALRTALGDLDDR